MLNYQDRLSSTNLNEQTQVDESFLSHGNPPQQFIIRRSAEKTWQLDRGSGSPRSVVLTFHRSATTVITFTSEWTDGYSVELSVTQDRVLVLVPGQVPGKQQGVPPDSRSAPHSDDE